MSGLTRKEREKLNRLDKRALKAEGGDSLDAHMDHQWYIQILEDKYGIGIVDNPYDVYNKGGDVKKKKKKKKVPVIAISVGTAEIKNGKAKMMQGGAANNKPHMYSGGGAVTDRLKKNMGGLANKKLSYGGKKAKDYRGVVKKK